MYNILERVRILASRYIKEEASLPKLADEASTCILHEELVRDSNNFVFGKLRVTQINEEIVNIVLHSGFNSLVIMSGKVLSSNDRGE